MNDLIKVNFDETADTMPTISGRELHQALEVKSKYADWFKNMCGYGFSENTDLLSTTQIAKDYGKSAVWLNKYLHEKGIQFKQGDIWLLYQKYAEFGYTSTKTHPYNGNDGQQHVKPHTYWTQKGRLFIYATLKNDGILPTIEKDTKKKHGE